MKSVFLFLFLGGISIGLYGQKPIADTSGFGKWQSVEDAIISNDGNYAAYSILNQPIGNRTLIIRSTKADWEQDFVGPESVRFTKDSKYAILNIKDSLCLLKLGAANPFYIPHVVYSRLLTGDKHEWLAYLLKKDSSKRTLVLRSFPEGKERVLRDVKYYVLNSKGDVLTYAVTTYNDGQASVSLHWLDLVKGDDKVIWSGADHDQVTNIKFNEQGGRVGFIVEGENRKCTIWCYQPGSGQAEEKLSDSSLDIDTKLSIKKGGLAFSKNGSKLYFQTIEKIRPDTSREDAVDVNIWSYTDTYLQAYQLNNLPNPRSYQMVLDLSKNRAIRLQGEQDVLEEENSLLNNDRYVLMKIEGGPDFWWQESARSSISLVSVADGSRFPLMEKIPYGHGWNPKLNFNLSPGESFIVYYDPMKGEYFSYCIASKGTYNLTTGIATCFRDEGNGDKTFGPIAYPIGIAGWLDGDKALLVYDNYDIWQLDPTGVKMPLNITKGYGKAHHIKFRIAKGMDEALFFTSGTPLLLSAFDEESKSNGFYKITLGEAVEPQMLTMGPYIYYAPGISRNGSVPIKAKNADVWVIKRENSEEAPNYFITRDFKHFSSLSNVQPHKKYNWLKAELIHWKAADSTLCTGIIYTPENFNPTKKYPVIFNYYETRSFELNEYHKLDVCKDNINIPYFVSRGYIVCVPDIPYVPENRTENIVNRVVSAAHYLAALPWIDSLKMGIQGHSYGGGETITILTHTHIFAAVMEAAGGVDGVAAYFQLTGYGVSRQYLSEIGQGHETGSLWERKNGFDRVNLSRLDQVTSPLLMMHNKSDGAVPWEHGIALFTGLRRLGKKVWWLEYTNGEHYVEGKDAMDYTVRMTQFFDHYLKDSLPPKWMTEGIPARLKGIETGYELDRSGKMP